MSDYSTFTYGSGVVYGHVTDVTAVRALVIADNLIELTFSGELVRNTAFLDPASYTASILDGNGAAIDVLQVLTPNSLTNDKVYLLTSYHSPGTTYQIVAAGLSGRAGQAVSGTFKFKSIVTKLDQMYKNIPTHFSRDPDGLVRNMLAAISMSDDRIGGARFDTLP
jgi:hypothetical protein